MQPDDVFDSNSPQRSTLNMHFTRNGETLDGKTYFYYIYNRKALEIFQLID